MKEADFAYMRNIDTRPGPNAGRSIDPTKPGPDADRIAELEPVSGLRVELAHLRNEQPRDKTDEWDYEHAIFGFHPDYSADFCCEVELLEGYIEDIRAGTRSQWPFWARLSRLLRFTREAGNLDEIAQRAKPIVATMEQRAIEAATSPQSQCGWNARTSRIRNDCPTSKAIQLREPPPPAALPDRQCPPKTSPL